MPFSDHGCLVAGRMKQFWKSLLIAIKIISIGHEAVDVAVFSGLDYRAARSANAISDVALVKFHALIRDAIHVRRGDS